MSDWKRVEMSPAWDYETQKEIEGVLIERKEKVGPNNSNMYMLELADQSIMGVWGTSVLDVRLGNLKVGEEVRIVYLGKTKSEKTGRSYHNFDVFHRPVEPPEMEQVED